MPSWRGARRPPADPGGPAAAGLHARRLRGDDAALSADAAARPAGAARRDASATGRSRPARWSSWCRGCCTAIARLWDQPDHFIPERFLPENAGSRQRYSYIPFSIGPRVCAGAAFGLDRGDPVPRDAGAAGAAAAGARRRRRAGLPADLAALRRFPADAAGAPRASGRRRGRRFRLRLATSPAIRCRRSARPRLAGSRSGPPGDTGPQAIIR